MVWRSVARRGKALLGLFVVCSNFWKLSQALSHWNKYGNRICPETIKESA
jgi:hypothetical protein